MRLFSPLVILAALLGVLFGLGAFTFHYGKGFSYFSTDPRSCVNCHVMQPYFDSWVKSSHHTAATCNDCHLPQDFLWKYLAKADNGFRHSWAFTFQNFHEPIQIIPRNSRILQNNCERCHKDVTHQMLHYEDGKKQETQCVHCHSGVAHW